MGKTRQPAWDTERDHQRAKEIGRRRLQVDEIKRRAQRWRLTDCDEETLAQMRHALIDEMEVLQGRLQEADKRFALYLENGRPLEVDQTLRALDRLTVEWANLNDHLQEIDEALLERHLRTRLIRTLGGERRLNLLDGAVLIAIVVVVALTIVELLVPLPAATIAGIVTFDTIICVFLIADFGLRLALAEDRGWYFRRYWIDLFASIPFYEFLRFGRLVRIARFVRLLRLGRAVRVLRFAFRGLDKLARTFQLNLLKRSVLIALVLLVVGALSIGALEAPQTAAAPSGLSESLWWSFATVVTGGFADLYNPNTLGGRLLTVGLVLLGLTVTGIFTASLTSVLVEDESSRIEQSQVALEARLSVINQKLDLLSGETNEGLIALETASQQLSNRRTRAGIAQVLTETMMRDFSAVQASVHLLDGAQARLKQVAQMGMNAVGPPERLPVGEGLAGRIVADLLAVENVAEVDLEPVTEPCVPVNGVSMVCPLVAAQRVLGVLHVVMPEDLGRYYLYNRVPMTLAHHAAVAFLAEESGHALRARRRGSGS
ncbi:MAG: ion transporter [Anaerolineales bacterium]|nr:ion transporter [Anaerolineales bacterium]